MTKDTEALRDDQWSDANMLRSIARDVDRWPSNATCDGAPTSADTLREIADRLDAALATPASDVVAGGEALREALAALEWYRDQLCEGFCEGFTPRICKAAMEENPTGGDCSGCRAVIALAALKGQTS